MGSRQTEAAEPRGPGGQLTLTFLVSGPTGSVWPPFLSAYPTLTFTFRYPPRPLPTEHSLKCVRWLCSGQVECAEVRRRVRRRVSYPQLHDDQSLSVDAEVRLAGRLARQAVAACRAPAGRLLQGRDRVTGRRQATDAVRARAQVPRRPHWLRPTTDGRRRLGRPS